MLKSSGFEFHALTRKSSGGRPRVDYVIKSLRDAQMFCGEAGTETGRAIMGVILDHHEEFQKLLDGDQRAHARLAEVALPSSGDPVLLLNTAVQMMREDQLALQQRVAELEAAAFVGARPGERTAVEVARALKLYSSTGKPHAQFVSALAQDLDIAARRGVSLAGHPTRFYTAAHLDELRAQVEVVTVSGACCEVAAGDVTWKVLRKP
ncbi:MAG: hypothetical protein KC492_24955 [Myxococcales bacterium]|nr:hypothetical protein [Myxococcales bacterium]